VVVGDIGVFGVDGIEHYVRAAAQPLQENLAGEEWRGQAALK